MSDCQISSSLPGCQLVGQLPQHQPIPAAEAWTSHLTLQRDQLLLFLTTILAADAAFLHAEKTRVDYLVRLGRIAGHHNDAFNLKAHLQAAFKTMKCWGLVIAGAFFNADSAFDTKEARKVCFNHQIMPNKRNRKSVKRARKQLFNAQVYEDRFVSERSFAWIDKSCPLLVRFDLKDVNFLAGYHLALALINLGQLFAPKKV